MLSGRPKIKLTNTPFDKALELVSIAGMVVLWLYVILMYKSLPDTIPIHYDLKGNIDGYGGKGTLFFLPVIGTIVVAGILSLCKVPHLLNYTTKITVDNAEWNYKLDARVLRLTACIITALSFFIVVDIVLSAETGRSYFGEWFYVALVVLILLPVIYMLLQQKRK